MAWVQALSPKSRVSHENLTAAEENNIDNAKSVARMGHW